MNKVVSSEKDLVGIVFYGTVSVSVCVYVCVCVCVCVCACVHISLHVCVRLCLGAHIKACQMLLPIFSCPFLTMPYNHLSSEEGSQSVSQSLFVPLIPWVSS